MHNARWSFLEYVHWNELLDSEHRLGQRLAVHTVISCSSQCNGCANPSQSRANNGNNNVALIRAGDGHFQATKEDTSERGLLRSHSNTSRFASHRGFPAEGLTRIQKDTQLLHALLSTFHILSSTVRTVAVLVFRLSMKYATFPSVRKWMAKGAPPGADESVLSSYVASLRLFSSS